MKQKIIQILISENQAAQIKTYSDIIVNSNQVYNQLKSNLEKSKTVSDGCTRWSDSLLKDIIGLRNLAEKELGDLLVSLQLSTGKIL